MQRLLTRVLRLVGRIARQKNRSLFSRQRQILKVSAPTPRARTPHTSSLIQDKGRLGEITVANHLGQLPIDEYTVMHDVMIQAWKGTSQIDHLVVSKYGIFVIETKNYNGKIYGSVKAQSWKQYINNAEYSFYNPVRQNEGHVRALRSILSGCGNVSIFPIVVFTGEVLLNVSACGAMVIYAYQLLPKIKEFESQLLSSEQVDHICRILVGASLNTDDPAVMLQHQADVDMAKAMAESKTNNLG